MVIINDELKNKELINLIHIIPEEHNLTEINNIIVKLHDNYYITNEEQQKLYSFINNGLEKIAQYELEYNDCQNTIDFYIVYLEKKLMDKQLSKEEERILKKYQNIIRERETKLLNPDSDTNNSQQTLKRVPKVLNTNGAVITVVILETTILLGILISVLALVKR